MKLTNKEISTLYVNGKVYSVRASVHAQERMIERNIDTDTITKNIYAIGKIRIMALKCSKDDVIIIDKKTNTSIVLAFNGTTISIITVIGKAKELFVKSNTTIVTL